MKESRKIVRFVCVSDTHRHHRDLELPEGDVLIHAGDFTQHGNVEEVIEFNSWLGEIKSRFKHIFVIAGNHDLTLDAATSVNSAANLLTNCVLLNNETVSVFGIKIYGSPVQPRIGRKYIAFARDFEERETAWRMAPSDTDIIVAHTPPYGHCDRAWGIKRSGCEALLAACMRIRPAFVVFGHIHAGYGTSIMNDGATKCINASSMKPLRVFTGLNAPIVFDIPAKVDR